MKTLKCKICKGEISFGFGIPYNKEILCERCWWWSYEIENQKFNSYYSCSIILAQRNEKENAMARIFDPIVPALHPLTSCRFITSEYLTIWIRKTRSWKQRLFSKPWKPFRKFIYEEVPDRNVYILHKRMINMKDEYGIGDWFICHPDILQEALRHVTILNAIEMDSETTNVFTHQPQRVQEFLFSRRYAKYAGKELNMKFIREHIKDMSGQLGISEKELRAIYYKAKKITFSEENKDITYPICCVELPFFPLSKEEKEKLKKAGDTISFEKEIEKILNPDVVSEEDPLP